MSNARESPQNEHHTDVQRGEEASTEAVSPKTEREKMLSGEAYLVGDLDLVRGRRRTRPLQHAYNTMPWDLLPQDPAEMPDFYGPKRRAILEELFGLSAGDVLKLDINIEPPFYCDYACEAFQITFGSRIMCGPNVHFYSATHSVDPVERAQALERAYPITVGNDVWIGGNCTIIGPCSIGDGVTVAAGSVAKGVLEPYCVYAGVPAKIIKRLDRPTEP